MEKPTVILEKERDFTDLLNATFAFIAQEFKMLFKVIGFYAGIFIIASAIMQSYYTENAFSGIISTFRNVFEGVVDGGDEVHFQPNIPMMFLMYIISLLSNFLICGLTFAYLAVYRDKGRNNFEMKDVWNAFLAKLPLALGLSIVTSLMIIIGMMFCFIPGIYLCVPLSFVLIILYAENKDFGESIGRSFKLVSQNWWATFGFLIIVVLIVYMLASIFSVPALVYGIIQGVTIASRETVGDISTIPFVITTVISGLGSGLVTPILYIAVGFQYFNLKEKKDKTSLFQKISEIKE